MSSLNTLLSFLETSQGIHFDNTQAFLENIFPEQLRGDANSPDKNIKELGDYLTKDATQRSRVMNASTAVSGRIRKIWKSGLTNEPLAIFNSIRDQFQQKLPSPSPVQLREMEHFIQTNYPDGNNPLIHDGCSPLFQTNHPDNDNAGSTAFYQNDELLRSLKLLRTMPEKLAAIAMFSLTDIDHSNDIKKNKDNRSSSIENKRRQSNTESRNSQSGIENKSIHRSTRKTAVTDLPLFLHEEAALYCILQYINETILELPVFRMLQYYSKRDRPVHGNHEDTAASAVQSIFNKVDELNNPDLGGRELLNLQESIYDSISDLLSPEELIIRARTIFCDAFINKYHLVNDSAGSPEQAAEPFKLAADLAVYITQILSDKYNNKELLQYAQKIAGTSYAQMSRIYYTGKKSSFTDIGRFEKAFQYAKKAADYQSGDGYSLLSMHYRLGIGCDSDIQQAWDYALLSLERNTINDNQLYFMAVHLEQHAMYQVSSNENYRELSAYLQGAINLYDYLERKNNKEAAYHLATIYQAQKKYGAALGCLIVATDNNTPGRVSTRACYELGRCYTFNLLKDAARVNKELALQYYKRASCYDPLQENNGSSQNGDMYPAAIYMIGYLLMNFYEEREEEALIYFRKALELGYHPAQHALFNAVRITQGMEAAEKEVLRMEEPDSNSLLVLGINYLLKAQGKAPSKAPADNTEEYDLEKCRTTAKLYLQKARKKGNEVAELFWGQFFEE